MHIVRFRSDEPSDSDNLAAIGVLTEDGKIGRLDGISSLADLWRLSLEEIQRVVTSASGQRYDVQRVRILAPIDGRTEVWAAGVTYEVSKYARAADSARSEDVYEDVYNADRPELFYKSASWRVVGDGEPVAVRTDSPLNVPEPELALVLNSAGEIAGYTICNDVSSRTLEGENPLYLPQAKVYLGSCSIGPGIRPVWEVPKPYDLSIAMNIERGAQTVWSGEGSTALLHRTYDDLARYLCHADSFPDGALLATGTCLVPEGPFSLGRDDVVTIAIAEVGRLSNHVVAGVQEMAWLDRGLAGRGAPGRDYRNQFLLPEGSL
jgi:2-dehydro-3-deoxy-D-arabinonate dehydratase